MVILSQKMQKSNKIKFLFLFSLLCFLSCGRLKNAAHEGINKGGEVVGSSASEFIDGVSQGIQTNTLCSLKISDSLISKGLDKGQYEVKSFAMSNDNKVTVYLIFNQELNDTVIMKAFNRDQQEIGRSKLFVAGAKDEAKYFDFLFDERTDIDPKGSLILE